MTELWKADGNVLLAFKLSRVPVLKLWVELQCLKQRYYATALSIASKDCIAPL